MPLEVGLVLSNRYRIEETIAMGGMGAIYRAADDTLGIHVAVKENFYTTNEFSRQFRREATILASLRHPNLPRVTDHFVIQEQGQYLVMDFIEGEDLRQLITRQGTLSEGEVLRIGISISDALTYLHTRNPAIVHRDIKPGNIKVTPSGQVVLVDFGLAKVSQGEATTTGAQALTPGYAPPEQYGQGTEPRSDLYALGATLYATLTGKIPEDGLSRAMGTVELTPIRKHNPAVSEKTARVIEKAMGVRPEERYQTADDFKIALDEALRFHQGLSEAGKAEVVPAERTQPKPRPPATTVTSAAASQSPTGQAPANLPVSAEIAASLPGVVPPPARRRSAMPVLLTLLGVVILSGLVIGGITLLARGGIFLPAPTATATQVLPSATLPPPTATQTAAPSATPVPPTATPAPADTATPAPATSTATPAATLTGGGGQQIAFASDRSGLPQVWLMNADGSDQRQITTIGDGACQPAWSPDGEKLVFISPCAGFEETYPGASMFVIRSDGTGLLPLASLPGGDYEPDWSPDGSQLVFTTLRDGRPHIYLYKLADNTVARLSPNPNYEQHPAWSADGMRITYQTTRGSGQPSIWIMAADGSSPKEFSSPVGGNTYSPDWSPLNDLMIYTRAANQHWLVSRQIDNASAIEIRVSDRIYPVYDPGFSPDGRWISFCTIQDSNTDIYIMNSSGASLSRLTDDAGKDFQPAWRP